MTETVSVALQGRSYDIVIDSGLLEKAGASIRESTGASRAFLITDATVGAQYGQRVEDSLKQAGIHTTSLTLPPGEHTKNFAELERVLETILSYQPDRRTVLVALGGGVIGDLTGFAASILLRGVPFVQIPTSLLAQVDSSVGGKTAINTGHGKNLVGSFYQPRLVLADTETLTTLPLRELKAGYAEVVKYALLGDAAFFEWLELHGPALLAGDTALRSEAIARCCRHKAAIVAEDETEQGARALLNLGHTFGHALEQAFGYDGRLLHGEGVALGMLLAARLSHALGYMDARELPRIEAHFRACQLPVTLADLPFRPETDALVQAMYGDKKAENGTLTFILMRRIGEAFIAKNVPAGEVRAIIETCP